MNDELIKTILSRAGLDQSSRISARPVGGGSINECYLLDAGRLQFFLKVNAASKFPQLFEKEAAGLSLIRSTKTIATPGIIACFEEGSSQYLLMEWVQPGPRTDQFWKNFGEQLAALHQCKGQQFGLDYDNYMGSVAQDNSYKKDWNHFFCSNRLAPLVEQLSAAGALSNRHLRLFERLYELMPQIFTGAQSPVLVHGDLWAGNFICTSNETACLIDPAVYYGHPAADLAMTTLFGGFDRKFYESYFHHAPIKKENRLQWRVANLYPLLIHLLLFGKSYLSAIEQTLSEFE